MVLTIILFQGLIFTGLIFILRHFMKGHVSGAVEHLQRLNDELIKQQTELKQKNAEAQTAYDQKMASIQQEMSQKQSQVREEANKTIEESRTRALAEREKIISEAVETREKMRQEIMAEMEEKAIQHAREILRAAFSGPLQVAIHETLLDEVLEGIKEANISHFQIQDGAAQLKSALPLKDTDKQKIQKVLKEKIKKDVELKEETDLDLIGGMILRFGTFVIDGSLRNRIHEGAAVLKKATARHYQKVI